MNYWASTTLCNVLKLEHEIIRRGNALLAQISGMK